MWQLFKNDVGISGLIVPIMKENASLNKSALFLNIVFALFLKLRSNYGSSSSGNQLSFVQVQVQLSKSISQIKAVGYSSNI